MNNYQLAPKLLIRSPLLPLKAVLTITDENQLKQLYKTPLIREALYLASPDFYDESLKWIDGKITDKGEGQRIKLTLMRYLIRMSSRSTPFGLFAGFNLAEWGAETNFILEDVFLHKTHTRLDMHYLCSLAKELAKHREIMPYLKFYPNSSLYEHLDSYRYVEGTFTKSNIRYEISEVEKTSYLAKIVEKAQDGAYLTDIANSLIDDDISFDEAYEFLAELAENQILISQLEPTITGREFLDRMLSILKNCKEKNPTEYICKVYHTLSYVKDDILMLDKKNSGNSVDMYQSIAEQLEDLKIPVNRKLLFQVDMVKGCKANKIDSKIAGRIRRGIDVLNYLATNNPQENLSRFKDAFIERYEREEVPLLQVLDNESGIGYLQVGDASDITPLIDDIHITGLESDEYTLKRNKVNRYFHDQYLDAIKSGSYEVVLKDSDLHNFNSDWTNLPASFSVVGSFFEGNTNKQDSLIYIKTVSAFSSAANFLGRFTHSDFEIEEFTRSITNHEQKLETKRIIAEIVHLPKSRTGNVLMRRNLRDYEIPFLAKSSVKKDNQITLQELRVSVDNLGKIRLRSSRLNKEIIPRLSSAHNFSINALPVYHFLCDLQFQEYKTTLNFNWAQTGIEYIYKPRLRYSNLILARATWLFSNKDLKFFNDDQIKDLHQEIRIWRTRWSIPRYVIIIEYDRELLIDFENPLFIEVFKNNVRSKHFITIAEFLFSPDSGFIKDTSLESYTNEFIATFLKVKPDRPLQSHGPPDQASFFSNQKFKRQFPLGSEWLYYKLYVGNKSSDFVLTNYLHPLIENLKRKNLIDKWFFIRYNDPKFHLRIRFHLKDPRKIGELITFFEKIINPILENRVISKITTDTYCRELERYGDSIENVENVFHVQSEMVIRFLTAIDNSEDQELLRLLFALKNLDNLFDEFQLGLLSKMNFSKDSSEFFEKEFNANSTTYKQLGKKYRIFQEAIRSVFADGSNLPEDWLLVDEIITENTPAYSNIISELREPNGHFKMDSNRLIWDLNHLFVNRLVRSKARKYEFVFYTLLHKYYTFRFKNAR